MGTRRLGVFLLLVAACSVHAQEPIRVGSKRFTESYILGEILAQTARGQHKAGLGNTAILVAALENDAIDVYPEYTGTITNEILRTEERLLLAEINRRLARLGLAASTPLGFSNSYALGTRRALRAISDLTRLPELRLGFSHEFLGRRDGWPGLDRKSTRLNSSHSQISYAVFCLKKKKKTIRYTILSHIRLS